jgi:hypothetical protein
VCLALEVRFIRDVFAVIVVIIYVLYGLMLSDFGGGGPLVSIVLLLHYFSCAVFVYFGLIDVFIYALLCFLVV